jgi:hypothetical protein
MACGQERSSNIVDRVFAAFCTQPFEHSSCDYRPNEGAKPSDSICEKDKAGGHLGMTPQRAQKHRLAAVELNYFGRVA